MLEIVVCEDDRTQRENMERFIENYIWMEGLDMKVILSTANPNEVLDFVKENEKTRLYFLDIDLKSDINGITLGSEIRKHDPHGFIIYVTTHPELTALTFTYKVGALDFIVKNNFSDIEEKVKECLNVAYNRYSKTTLEKKFFKINSGSKSVFIDYNEIIFFETDSDDRKVVLYTENKRIKFTGTLKDIVRLDDCLVRCHQSYVVNKRHIAEINKREGKVYMSNGDICLISRNGLRLLSK